MGSRVSKGEKQNLKICTVVHVTIRVGTLGYDVVPAICDTCQKTS